MNIDHYPFRFVKKDIEPWEGPQGFLMYRLLYSFKSPKSHQTYWVWVEVYKHHFYAVKFHLKAHRHSEYKYNLMTGLYEARQCIRTCMAIMQEVAKNDPMASFGFIGANRIDESEVNTKRFRVYRRFMLTCFGNDEYLHQYNIAKSTYIMINRKQLSVHPQLLDEIVSGFRDLYSYFD
jgi:hypothetical protein